MAEERTTTVCIKELIPNSGRYFIKSSNVKVFPCAWRNESYDTESRINTEYNFTNLSGVESTRSYIAEPTEGTSSFTEIVFYLHGYRFVIKNKNGLPHSAFANIKFRSVTLQTATGTSNSETTKVLANIYRDAEQPLDVYVEGEADYYFGGLCITSGTALEGADATLQLTGADDSIYSNSYLPEIYHGSGNKAIQICSGAIAHGDESLAVGADSLVEGNSSIAIGCNSEITNGSNSSIVVGNNLKANKADQVLIGNGISDHRTTSNANIAIISGADTILGITKNDSAYKLDIKADEVHIGAQPGADKITINTESITLDHVETKIKGRTYLINNALTATDKTYLHTDIRNKSAEGTPANMVATIDIDAETTFKKDISIQNDAKIVIGSGNNEIKFDKTFTLKTNVADVEFFKVTNGNITISAGDMTDSKKTALKISASSADTLLDVNNKLIVKNSEVTLNASSLTFGEANNTNNTINLNNSKIINAGTIIFGTNTTSTAQIYINTDGGEIKATTFWATSDRRAKENISEYKSQKSILDLPVYKYDYINGPKNQIGCMAQDLREICPEMVHEETNGMLSVDNSKVVYLLLDEVKKLKKELNALKTK